MLSSLLWVIFMLPAIIPLAAAGYQSFINIPLSIGIMLRCRRKKYATVIDKKYIGAGVVLTIEYVIRGNPIQSKYRFISVNGEAAYDTYEIGDKIKIHCNNNKPREFYISQIAIPGLVMSLIICTVAIIIILGLVFYVLEEVI